MDWAIVGGGGRAAQAAQAAQVEGETQIWGGGGAG